MGLCSLQLFGPSKGEYIYTGNNLFDELGMLEVSFMFVNGNAWTILNLCPLGDNS